MENRVISLSSARARRKHIADTFGARGIPFRFFDALMPSEELNRAMEELVPGLAKQHLLSEVEKACFMSHVVLWKQALDEGLPYVAVFEDDVLLGENAEKFLAEDAWLEERFAVGTPFIVRLETIFSRVIISPSRIPDYQNRAFAMMESEHMGMAGYIISCEAMRFFLTQFAVLKTGRLEAVDHMLFKYNLFGERNVPAYQIVPALCAQELHYTTFLSQDSRLGSSLESDRKVARRQERALIERFKRIFTKLDRMKRRKEERKRNKCYGRQIVPFE